MPSCDETGRIRILHLVPDLDAGGLQHGLVQLIARLPSDRFVHEVCCLHGSGRAGARLSPEVPVHELYAGWHDPRTPVRLTRIARQFHPHVIHARNWSTWPDSTIARMMTRQPRLVFSLHGWDTDQPISRSRATVCRWLARRTDQLCAVSRRAADLFAREIGLAPSTFEILPNGVDVHRFQPLTDRQAVRREWGIPPEAIVIGSAGRLEPIKDYPTLLTAFARLLNQVTHRCELLLIGDGAERESLHRAAWALGIADHVRLLGWQENMPRLLNTLDVFTLTSRREGMSNAILEAMACGLPIVATAVGGNPELVRHGVHGSLITPRNVPELTRALLDMTRSASTRTAMGQRSRQRAVHEFSLERTTQRYARMYTRLARTQEGILNQLAHPVATLPS